MSTQTAKLPFPVTWLAILASSYHPNQVKPLTWHDFRRSFAGNLLDNGHDLVTVQKLMGHVSPTTTSNYDRRGEEAKRRASRSLHVPHHRRTNSAPSAIWTAAHDERSACLVPPGL
jgi:site-specific recombinase XerD